MEHGCREVTKRHVEKSVLEQIQHAWNGNFKRIKWDINDIFLDGLDQLSVGQFVLQCVCKDEFDAFSDDDEVVDDIELITLYGVTSVPPDEDDGGVLHDHEAE